MLLYQIAATLLSGVGDVNGKKLVEFCGSAEAVFTEKKQGLKKIPGIGESTVNAIVNSKKEALLRAEEEVKFIEKTKVTPLFFTDENYPQRLTHCIDAPMMLYYKGNANLNAIKVISVVGTRSITEYGKSCCTNIIRGFEDSEILVVSGLAYGVDTCAHKDALKYNLSTVGVLAHGLDKLYPQANLELARKMLDQGGLLTDYMSQTNPDKENFPKRNRIIAGMADAVVVIEAAKRGGALITADIANSYNRDVFAVPGRLGDTYSEGCNHFIKTNKAMLVQTADDIKYIMGWQEKSQKKSAAQKKLFINLPPEEEKLHALLTKEGEMSMDALCASMEMPPSKVAAALLNLEFEGLVKSLPGKIYKLM